jgi:hypothetical protein
MPLTPLEKKRLERDALAAQLVASSPVAGAREIYAAMETSDAIRESFTGGATSASYDASIGAAPRFKSGEPVIPTLPTRADNAQRNAEDRLGEALGATALKDRLSAARPFEPKMLRCAATVAGCACRARAPTSLRPHFSPPVASLFSQRRRDPQALEREHHLPARPRVVARAPRVGRAGATRRRVPAAPPRAHVSDGRRAGAVAQRASARARGARVPRVVLVEKPSRVVTAPCSTAPARSCLRPRPRPQVSAFSLADMEDHSAHVQHAVPSKSRVRSEADEAAMVAASAAAHSAALGAAATKRAQLSGSLQIK